eukprot:8906326-Alexandrium_andersonii.AAC.1
MYFARGAPVPGVIVKWRRGCRFGMRCAGSVYSFWVDGSGVGHVVGDGRLWASGGGWQGR